MTDKGTTVISKALINSGSIVIDESVTIFIVPMYFSILN